MTDTQGARAMAKKVDEALNIERVEPVGPANAEETTWLAQGISPRKHVTIKEVREKYGHKGGE